MTLDTSTSRRLKNKVTNRQTDKQTNKQKKQTNKHTINKQTNKQTCLKENGQERQDLADERRFVIPLKCS